MSGEHPTDRMDLIDRIAPTRRPADRVVMRQIWEQLLFLHWTVDPAQLTPLLPPGLTLDTYEGKAYVGLVPFTMRGVRPVWSPPVRGLSDFHEVNVRTYVHYRGANPGVWFFSLDAANSPAVRIARAMWKLPYYRALMSLEQEGETTVYRSERLWPAPTPAACHVRYRPTGTPGPSAPGTREHFLAERYFLYASARGRLLRGQVHHTPYPLQTAELEHLEDTLVRASGIIPAKGEIGSATGEKPVAHFASGVTVDVYPLRPVAL